MIFNPLTQDLYTEDMVLIKRLHCPLHKNWEMMQPDKDGLHRICDSCHATVIDTQQVDEAELVRLVHAHPDTCLKIDLNQVSIKTDINGFYFTAIEPE